MVICQGCGQAFEVPAGYSRNKIQCPACGVICAVPADAGRQPTASSRGTPSPAAAEPPLEDQAVSWMSEPEPAPAPLFDNEPRTPPPATSVPPVRKPREAFISCRRCGRKIRKQRECPSCDAAAEESEEQKGVEEVAPAMPAMELDLPPGAVTWGPEDEDVSPYVLADKDLPVCPKCRKRLADPEAVFCTACGFDFQTRRKAVRTYQPIARSWVTDLSLEKRLLILGAVQGIHWCLALVWAAAGFSAWPFVVSWPLLTLLICFVVGTYDRTDLVRDRKGRVKITKRWHFFFVPLTPMTTSVRGYEGVTTGQWNDAGVLEWFIFGSLLFTGVLPAVIYWYKAIYQVHFHVALASDHGHAEVWVYRGCSEEQMNDIADAVCNATGLARVS